MPGGRAEGVAAVHVDENDSRPLPPIHGEGRAGHVQRSEARPVQRAGQRHPGIPGSGEGDGVPRQPGQPVLAAVPRLQARLRVQGRRGSPTVLDRDRVGRHAGQATHVGAVLQEGPDRTRRQASRVGGGDRRQGHDARRGRVHQPARPIRHAQAPAQVGRCS